MFFQQKKQASWGREIFVATKIFVTESSTAHKSFMKKGVDYTGVTVVMREAKIAKTTFLNSRIVIPAKAGI